MTFDDSDTHDDARDARLAELARGLRVPAEAPREAMWEAIAAARRERREAPRVLPLRRWLIPAAIAAALVLGVALGRLTGSRGGTPSGVEHVAVIDSGGDLAQRVNATQYLTRAEVLLTSFRARGGSVPDAQFVASARDLLVLTTLMKDAPAAAQDPALRVLLEDLELILVQIVQLAPGAPSADTELVNQGLDARGLLPRLRTAIPAGPTAPATGVS